MSPLTRSALAAAAALASFAASARDFPPMDIMAPHDTPDTAAERIVVPDLASDIATPHGDAGIENANASPPSPPDVRDAAMPVLEVGDVLSVRARDERGGRDDKGERDEKGERDDKGGKGDKPGGRDGG
jgi:hypothetical protein